MATSTHLLVSLAVITLITIKSTEAAPANIKPEKPGEVHAGECPPVLGEGFGGICALTCEDDSVCGSTEKCCPTACGGTSCMKPVEPTSDVPCPPGWSSNDNFCNFVHTEQSYSYDAADRDCEVHAGECPPVLGEGFGGICAITCEDDSVCGSTEKCCPTACGGTSCMKPVEPTSGEVHAGECPPVLGEGFGGICALTCEDDSVCGSTEKCCPTACGGTSCMKPVEPTSDVPCPPGWSSNDNFCYFVHTEQSYSYEAADRDCASKNARLLSIHLKEEQDYIDELVKQNTRGIGFYWRSFWIDLHFDTTDQAWKWGDDKSTLDFVNWAPNQPDGNPEEPIYRQDCGMLSAGRWLDYPCTAENAGYICRRERGLPDVENVGQCPPVEGEADVGICASACEDDGGCGDTQKCCPTACGGTSCMEAIQVQPPEKPDGGNVGQCPPVDGEAGFGICAFACKDDSGCGDTQKCCPTACGGTSCMEAIQVQPPEKPDVGNVGQCPPIDGEAGFGICAFACEDDGGCGDTQKCCPTACGGTSCMEAIQVQPPEKPDVENVGQCPPVEGEASVGICAVACEDDSGCGDTQKCCPTACGGTNCMEAIQVQPPEKPGVDNAGQCPPVDGEAGFGICAFACKDDSGCGDTQKCCPTACGGTSCMEAIQVQPPEKPVENVGQCPPVDGEAGFGICAFACEDDSGCGDTQKCCPTACGGTSCMEAIQVQPPEKPDVGNVGQCPPVEGEAGVGICAFACEDDGGCGDSQKCCPTACGGMSCTEAIQVQPPERPTDVENDGQCPPTANVRKGGFGICGFECENDGGCGDTQKCCPTACGGTSCMEAISGTEVEQPEKPDVGNVGQCPPTVGEGGIGICAFMCEDDGGCGDTQKCCPTACGGTSCMEAIQVQPPERPTDVENDGQCPSTANVRKGGFGICGFECENDGGCGDTQKCCPTACGGTSCMEAIGGTEVEQPEIPDVENVGQCPPVEGEAGFGICAFACEDDSGCGDTQKCCPTACGGTSCMEAIQVQPPEPIEPGPCYPNPCLNGGTCEVKYVISYGCTCASGFAGLQCQNKECTPDAPEMQCFTNPCDDNPCPAFPEARCRHNFCGGCNAVYFDDNGNEVDCAEQPEVVQPPVIPRIGRCTYACTRDYTPVCGTDGNTHSNECEMGRAACNKNIEITVDYAGGCRPGQTGPEPPIVVGRCTYACTRDYRPVCGTDGNTHANECEMGRAACNKNIEITVGYKGACRPGQTGPEPPIVVGRCTYACTRDYTPVCGTDGNTHSNECEMGRAACNKNIEITAVHAGECQPDQTGPEPPIVVGRCTYACTRDYRPVCGSDGNTHSNECEMGRAACNKNIEITVEYARECQPDQTGPEPPIVIGRCTYACTRNFAPVCGTDGNTHSNVCEMGRAACNKNIEITAVHAGECQPGQTGPEPPIVVGRCTYACTRDYRPVCGTDGNTHSNECEMGRAACNKNIEITEDYAGECQPDQTGPEPPIVVGRCTYACTRDYTPVCGTDGNTHSNECEMGRTACNKNIEITAVHAGECQPGQTGPEPPIVVGRCTYACTRNYAPVCGTDGNTHSNVCEMGRAACNKNIEITAVHAGECQPDQTGPEPPIVVGRCTYACTRDYRPVCGTDGNTHSNECEMGRAACNTNIEIAVDYAGECRSGCNYVCTREYRPVCGTDGITHSNVCEMGRAACNKNIQISAVYEGECQPVIQPPVIPIGKCTYFCTRELRYVCGTDGNTHDNVCEMGRAACNQNIKISVDYEGECQPEPQPTPRLIGKCTYFCTRENVPVCGTDGNTHSNECEMGRAACNKNIEITVDYAGECQAVKEEGPCYPNPCLNGGTCAVRFRISHRCTCAPGFSGLQCQIMECTPEAPGVACYSNPCDAVSCAAFPDARCAPNFCGGCNAVYFNDDGNAIDCKEPVCTDLDNNIVRHGESFRRTENDCVDCMCLDGEAVCPVVDCPQPRGRGCIPTYEKGACCPIYDCAVPPPVIPVIGTCTYACTRDYTPVCGTDGNTHSNDCEMGRAACNQNIEITVDYAGECQPEEATCKDKDGRAVSEDETFRPLDSCIDCICRSGEPLCPIVDCFAPRNSRFCTSEKFPDECCPRYSCPEGCVDRPGPPRQFSEVYEDGCEVCVCDSSGFTQCSSKPCFKPDPVPGCEIVSNPPVEGSCCPEYIDICQASCFDVDGNTRGVGDSYLGRDGCNQCTCLAGAEACTRKACLPLPSDPPATAFIQEPEDAYVSRYSQPVTLTCSADVSSRELLSFECNGQAVESTQIEYTEEAGNHVASIEIDRLQVETDRSEEGFWCQCVAVDNEQQTHRSRKAIVAVSYIRRQFEEEPVDTSAFEGQTILMRCAPPVGYPTPTITWEKDGEPLDISASQRHILLEGGSLEIADIERADEGQYVCVAENNAYVRRSNPAAVTFNM